MKTKITIIILLLITLLAYQSTKVLPKYFSQNNLTATPVDTVLPDPQTNNVPPTITINKPTQTSEIVFPMTNFDDRITLNWYGNHFTPQNISQNDTTAISCAQGIGYLGYHTGDDLEVTKDELNTDVSVYAIADGIVKKASTVKGYGGLVVIEHVLDGQIYTTYYGHININSITIKAGDQVTAGQKIAVLGDQCSAGNGFTRKHLHFALHKGTGIDVRGYVPDTQVLNNWIDPKPFLDKLANNQIAK